MRTALAILIIWWGILIKNVFVDENNHFFFQLYII